MAGDEAVKLVIDVKQVEVWQCCGCCAGGAERSGLPGCYWEAAALSTLDGDLVCWMDDEFTCTSSVVVVSKQVGCLAAR